jgi:hypothetical protein
MKKEKWKMNEIKGVLGTNIPHWNLSDKFGFGYISIPKGYDFVNCNFTKQIKPNVVSINLVKKKKLKGIS